MLSRLKDVLRYINPTYRKLSTVQAAVERIERYSRHTYLRQYHNPNTVLSQSQYGQDIYVESILGGLRNGTFLEMGAGDGISASNSYYLEKALGWRGVLIEANPKYHPLLSQNRPDCHCIQACVSNGREVVDFIDQGGLSGIKRGISTRHESALASAPVLRVETEPLQSILDRVEVRHIDYLSLDVEGNELQVLESLDFSKTHVTVFGIEINPSDHGRAYEPISRLLKGNGYRFVEKIEIDHFFYKAPRGPA